MRSHPPTRIVILLKQPTGYQATWKISESKQRHTVDGTEFITTESTLSLTITPYKEPDKPEVNLYGCSELGMEEQGEVMASGKPEGGKYRFWVEPGNLLTVESDGESSAIIKGSTPGKGTLYVEYTTPEGKQIQLHNPLPVLKSKITMAGRQSRRLHFSMLTERNFLVYLKSRFQPNLQI